MTVGVQYLLPCSCGQQVVVEPRQAGEMTSCSCGAMLHVPTLLDMRKLELAEQKSTASARADWGPKQQLRMLGIVLLAAALGIGGWLLAHQPTSQFLNVDAEQVRQNAQKLPPVHTWKAWQSMKQRIDPRVDQKYADDLQIFHLEMSVLAVIAVLGIAVIVTGEMVERATRR
jgi:hypothetical protein